MKKDLLRPTTLDDYIGQEGIKDVLSTSMVAAKRRDQALDHILLNGPPGLGKTTLANIIGNEMSWKVRAVIAPSLSNANAIEDLFMFGWQPKTILFIDEVHRLKKAVQETLYPILEDNALQFEAGDKELTPLTIIGATTNIGRLERPFIDRFGLQFQLQYYTDDEIADILTENIVKLKMSIGWPGIDEIARRSRSTPRIANYLLKRLRDYAEVNQQSEITAEFADKILTDKLHIDKCGLTIQDRRYLKALRSCPEGLGVDALSSKMQEEVETLEDYIEPFLIRLGLVERTRTGRCLTTEGERYLTSIPKRLDR